MNVAPYARRLLRFVTFRDLAREAGTGSVPLLALQPRRVTDDEISALAAAFRRRRTATIGATDVGVAITTLTGELPAAEEIDRVRARLTVMCEITERYE